ncbi:hypothetical protein HMN09_00567700 [Mycena chlorophos]|uniref:BTB domain-containing protein n=1 Tax=Mycena chlorophos TaxID=658473 RepID=A0A8H6WEX5_MYCCL|nr:hypothetical protein HMN09_00567700 [Mycena chlorophos]
MNDPNALLRVPDLWFPDATLVFQAENTQYRVYAGLLAARSSVFADMLAFPQPVDSDDETVDGCPCIVLPDKAEDVTCFFRAIFDSSFFVPPFTTALSFATLSAILRLSQKYDVEYLRQRCLSHLSAIYPTTLEDWDACGYAEHILGLGSRMSPPIGTFPILPTLELAAEAEAPWLVPALMYLGLCAGMEGILDGIALECSPVVSAREATDNEQPHLGRDAKTHFDEGKEPPATPPTAVSASQRALLRAFPALLSSTSTAVSFLLSPRPSGCTSPAACTSELVSLRCWVDASWSACHFPLEIWEEQDWDAVRGDVCDVCIAQGRKLHREARQRFWNGLPKMLGLELTWTELRRLQENALRVEM